MLLQFLHIPEQNHFLIYDCRLNLLNENNTLNGLPSLQYDSDHNAVFILASLNSNDDLDFFKKKIDTKLDYKRTNWRAFQNKITNQCNIPNQTPILQIMK